ncbi:MAG TPA: hypothetical protein VJN18_32650 [Polyangiaceae bacterium]|nr:hypothetical protein [Polyangiaceae bacterium]
MGTKLTIPGAIALLKTEQSETEQRFAEATALLRQVESALAQSDRAEAARLLTAAADVAHGLDVDIGELFDELGLRDLAIPEDEA